MVDTNDKCYAWAMETTGYEPVYFEEFTSIETQEIETASVVENILLGGIGGALLGLVLQAPITGAIAGMVLGGFNVLEKKEVDIDVLLEQKDGEYSKEEKFQYKKFHHAYNACKSCN
ncbi:hypothetical protein [Flammeovirga kamogawensis]|uniref:Glycine zipper domain-containing protein n=1 Tax=Flammeovirga kamogawensis TaxID=373891 RepID=A0ABX8H0V6_9BACT|nr:hypothetical protein [Flammeovirga kamogawensis]MBB6462407.1 hypothetical protein [Flammeovirga kamogawensis]QWG09519.1 hypothetical protein KM029_23210 [Flammeovirga kamogawensis]TRX65035.1 hypothetical protein EO216_21110 [Flammeovirga kamogawensis]